MDLAGTVDAVVAGVDHADLLGQFPVAGGAGGLGPGVGGVVGARRDLGVRFLQGVADRLDAELLFVLIDVGDLQRSGRSSSAAKKAEADFKIVLARRSSFTSRSSSAIRAASWEVVPARAEVPPRCGEG
jgi:hypothetical protein